MELQDFVIDALELVLAWGLPDDACIHAVSDLAGLMAGMDSEHIGVPDLE